MSVDAQTVAEVRDLRIEVAGRAIVDGVSLRARSGQVTALVGASGSGKTTTGLALLGEHPAGATVTGEVRVAEGLVGYVPQHPAAVLNPARRVGALLADIARGQVRDLPRGQRRAAARASVLHALESAQLPDGAEVIRRYPHQLSGGQQQRVVLAQALLLGARVIVADEPTTGQDALTKRRVVGELAAVARRGIALVLLSHDLDVVRELADEVFVMCEGRVVEHGPAARLWADPQHPWTRELLATLPVAADDRLGPAATARTAPPPAHVEGAPQRAAGEEAGPAQIPAATPGRATGPAAAVASSQWPPEEAAPGALTVRGLTARHRATGRRGTVAVLRDAELAVSPGECLAVVGRSGSGKTTLARCVAGLHRSYEGEVRLDGAALPRSLRERSRAQLAAVQYVFQDAHAAFDEYRPVLDQVARTAVRLRGVDPQAAHEEAAATLAETGIGAQLAARRPGQLSGGELQRAALARALLARPRVLLCDEITSGLDTVTRRGILELLVTLLRERSDLALVLITHDLETAALAHRVAVLDAGEIVESGSARQVLTAPRHSFTASLVAASRAYGLGPAAPADATEHPVSP
ncbi:ABC transporter ATP-binding protein [Streptomyces zagrosensis]|uniref:Peptide/nickel transport system ATP-binding protein n=1 Tax=Streptomyces zagrosensis TaxID=1042984 RepID=A0A7W9QCT5_9ACTN|nr:ATP-binding cassette domain-containing protein [Streptomyces zagrosensis]MBB5937850.1 peptide/nickel transport system ATP-binding protein [Streptomyces zagrosensis]